MTSILDHFYNAFPLKPGACVARTRVSLPSRWCVPGFMFRRRDSRLPKWWNGRHARLRGVWRKPCGFKSRLRHQPQQSFDELAVLQQFPQRRYVPFSTIFRRLFLPAGAPSQHVRRPPRCAATSQDRRLCDDSSATDKRPYSTRAQLHSQLSIISNRLLRLGAMMCGVYACSLDGECNTSNLTNVPPKQSCQPSRIHAW